MNKLGENIFALRKQHDMTQEKLATTLGVSIAAVSKWETGASIPDLLMLCDLADFFQVSTDFLLGREITVNKYFLTCDDSMFLGSAVTEIIHREGYDAKAVDNSAWLFKEIESRKPEGVFLDVHFPNENGFDILKRLKAEYSDIKVVMLTADMSEETARRAEELGADGFVYKPFSPEHLKNALCNIM